MLHIKAIPTTIVGNIPGENYIKKHYPKGYIVFTYDVTSNTCLVFDFENDEDGAWEFINQIPDSDPYAIIVENGIIISENT